MIEWIIRLQTIDRRIIYALVIGLITLALLWDFSLPQPVSPEARSLYDTIQALPRNKLVVVAADWGAATRGECAPLTAAVVAHLFKVRHPFAIVGFVPQGPELTTDIVEQQAKQVGARYGRDWCNWGYKVSIDSTLLSLVQNIAGTIPQDVNGTRIEQVPVMKHVKSINDIGLIVEITGSGFLDAYLRRIPRSVKIAQGCTGVIGPEQYPYVDSGQLCGLLVGMKGAAEYEHLVGFRGQATKAMRPQSLAHLLIIMLIILGNIGMYVAAKQGRDLPGKGGTPA